nr:sodium:solute symporter family protein [bacterium]
MEYVILGVYVLVLAGIAFFASRKSRTADDFLLGGRRVGPWLSAFSYATSYFSAVIFIGYAGRNGWNYSLSATWIGIGNAVVGSLLAWWVLAGRTRRMTHRLGVSTMPSFFEKRYGSRAMKIIAAVAIFIFLVPYSASVYQGLGYLFEAVFGLNFVYCMVIMVVLTAGYLLAGGYFTSSWTDFFQGIVILIGMGLMFFYVFTSDQVGGFSEGVRRLQDMAAQNRTPAVGSAPWQGLWATVMLTSLGVWGLPQMVHKFYAVRDGKAARRAMIISSLFALVVGGGAYLIGAFGPLFITDAQFAGELGGTFDRVVPAMLSAALPKALMALIVVLLLAASMSTLSALALASSSSLTMDLIKPLKTNMGDKATKNCMRLLCLLFILVSMGLALKQVAAMQTLMNFSWGVLAGTFLGPYLWGICWKRTTTQGAWAGFAGGLVTALVLMLVWKFNAARSPMVGCISMVVSLVAVPVVSLFTKPDAKLVEAAFGSDEGQTDTAK